MLFRITFVLLLASSALGGIPFREAVERPDGRLYSDGLLSLYFAPSSPRLAVESYDDAGRPATGVAEVDAMLRHHEAERVMQFYPGVLPEGPMREVSDRWYRVVFPEGADMDAIAADFSRLPGVVEAVAEPVRRATFTPNDTYYSSQWALPKIHADSAWGWLNNHGQHLPQVLIGIVDTGVQWDHTDLYGVSGVNVIEDVNGSGYFENVAYPAGDVNNFDDDGNGFNDDVVGWDFMSNDRDPRELVPEHGTHVCGCAIAVTNNGIGIAGTGYQIRFVATRHGNGTGFIYNGFAGVMYMSGIGAHVVNCSWGGPDFGQSEQDFLNVSPILLVGAAGNDYAYQIQYPASYEHCLNVGATNSNDQKASWSNYGPWIDVMAPGVNIVSTWQTNSYAFADGTSMASPIAAGVCGLIKGQNLALPRDSIIAIIKRTCDDIYPLNPGYPYPNLGEGRVNALLAVQDAYNTVDAPDYADASLPATPRITSVAPNPFNPATTITFALPEASSITLTAYDVLGRKVATIADGAFSAGAHNVRWDASGVASGTYFVRLATANANAMTKVVVLK